MDWTVLITAPTCTGIVVGAAIKVIKEINQNKIKDACKCIFDKLEVKVGELDDKYELRFSAHEKAIIALEVNMKIFLSTVEEIKKMMSEEFKFVREKLETKRDKEKR